MGNPAPVTIGGYWVNDYEKPCKQDTTKFCDDLVHGFLGAMRSQGHRVEVLRREKNASPRHWERTTDDDPHGVDTVAFGFLATHGGTHGTERSGGSWLHWVNATFNSQDGCRISTIELNRQWRPPDPRNPKTAMRLGDGSLRWVILDLCRSLQVRLENEKGLADDPDRMFELREATPGKTWTRCFAGVHVIFGFTGLASDAEWTATRGARFGKRAGAGEALTESWLDEAYSYWVDDAPVALAWGRSPDEARRRLISESLAHPEPDLTPADVASSWLWRS